MSLDGNEDAIVGALKQSLRQLETLGAQRAGLEDMLKEMKRKDDMLPKLMASTGSHEDLYKKELAKYDQICEEIAQNIEAQEQLLLQIEAQNDEFAAVFNLEDYKVAREKCYKQISAAVAKYREIKENVNEGLKFYVTLQDAITNAKQQCSDFVMTRNIQCREMIEDVQGQIADGKTGYGYPPANPPRNAPQRPEQPSHHPQLAINQTTGGQPRPGYSQPYPAAYATPQQPTYYGPSGQYQQQRPQHEFGGQPAYPGWRGPYYNTNYQQQQQQQQQQLGSHPAPHPPPYTVPSPYPPQHYRPQ